ncbi:hypothetical protein JCM8547_005569 [Rhodosporidiobolus lusitaniae]
MSSTVHIDLRRDNPDIKSLLEPQLGRIRRSLGRFLHSDSSKTTSVPAAVRIAQQASRQALQGGWEHGVQQKFQRHWRWWTIAERREALLLLEEQFDRIGRGEVTSTGDLIDPLFFDTIGTGYSVGRQAGNPSSSSATPASWLSPSALPQRQAFVQQRVHEQALDHEIELQQEALRQEAMQHDALHQRPLHQPPLPPQEPLHRPVPLPFVPQGRFDGFFGAPPVVLNHPPRTMCEDQAHLFSQQHHLVPPPVEHRRPSPSLAAQHAMAAAAGEVPPDSYPSPLPWPSTLRPNSSSGEPAFEEQHHQYHLQPFPGVSRRPSHTSSSDGGYLAPISNEQDPNFRYSAHQVLMQQNEGLHRSSENLLAQAQQLNAPPHARPVCRTSSTNSACRHSPYPASRRPSIALSHPHSHNPHHSPSPPPPPVLQFQHYQPPPPTSRPPTHSSPSSPPPPPQQQRFITSRLPRSVRPLTPPPPPPLTQEEEDEQAVEAHGLFGIEPPEGTWERVEERRRGREGRERERGRRDSGTGGGRRGGRGEAGSADRHLDAATRTARHLSRQASLAAWEMAVEDKFVNNWAWWGPRGQNRALDKLDVQLELIKDGSIKSVAQLCKPSEFDEISGRDGQVYAAPSQSSLQNVASDGGYLAPTSNELDPNFRYTAHHVLMQQNQALNRSSENLLEQARALNSSSRRPSQS